MCGRKLLLLSVVVSVGLLVSGCFFTMPWERTGNQGGSTLLSLGAKILGIAGGTGSFQDLNPDDLQLLVDTLNDAGVTNIPAVSDNVAQAGVDVLAANNIGTIEDIDRVVQAAEQDPDSLVIPDSVNEALVAEVEALIEGLAEADFSDIAAAF